MDENINNGLLTKIWGPPAWTSMNCYGFGYPIEPTEDDKKHYQAHYESYAYVLPCKFCRESYAQFILEEDTKLGPDVFKSRDTLTRWLYNIREKVNKKLGVTYGVTYEDFVKKHEAFRAKCVKDKLVNGCSMPLQDRTNAFKMAYNKECPLIDVNIAKKFIPYAKQRGYTEKDFAFINLYKQMRKNNVYGENMCDIWFERNKECEDITRYMRTHDIKPLEDHGVYKDMPTISELKLILNLTSTLTKEDLIKASNIVPKLKRYIIKKNN